MLHGGGTFPRLALKQEMVRLGQVTASEYVTMKIIRNNPAVIFMDKSSNDTWVNINKVGKEKIWPLKHNSEMGFAESNQAIYEKPNRW